jgi:hypothetical protein
MLLQRSVTVVASSVELVPISLRAQQLQQLQQPALGSERAHVTPSIQQQAAAGEGCQRKTRRRFCAQRVYHERQHTLGTGCIYDGRMLQ